MCELEKVQVMPEEVERGDLVVDLGFTVDRVYTNANGVYVTDGDRRLFLTSGYELAVCRTWEGRDHYLSNE